MNASIASFQIVEQLHVKLNKLKAEYCNKTAHLQKLLQNNSNISWSVHFIFVMMGDKISTAQHLLVLQVLILKHTVQYRALLYVPQGRYDKELLVLLSTKQLQSCA